MKIGIIGACGKMGVTLSEVAQKENIEIVHFFDIKNIGEDYGKLVGNNFYIGKKIEELEKTELISDTLIDFSSADSILKTLEIAKKYNQKLVIGTTGFTNEVFDEIRKVGNEIAVLYSPNMSIGINLIFEVLEFLSKNLDENYEFDLLEIHHKQKKDKPSGTAKKMLEIINKNRNTNIEGHSMRLGNIFGEHSVVITGNDEKIEINHTAMSRILFAKGAFKAAKFLQDKEKGYFTMKNCLNLEEIIK